MDAIFDLTARASNDMRKNMEYMDLLHGRVQTFLSSDAFASTSFVRDTFISLDDLARLAFHDDAIAVNRDASSGSKIVLMTERQATHKESSAQSILATYQYLKASGSNFFEPCITSVPSFQTERMFRVLTKEEVWEIQFLQSELAGYSSRRSLATTATKSINGETLRSFIAKISLVSQDKSAVVSFTNAEQVFIKSAHETLHKNQSSFSPFIELFYGVYRILSKGSLMQARQNPKSAALELLQMLRFESKDFPICRKAVDDNDLDVMTSLRKDTWSNQLNVEINARAEDLMSGLTTLRNESIYNHLLLSNVGATEFVDNIASFVKPATPSLDSIEHLRQEHILPVYVIDSPTANELDDGFSIEPVLDSNGNTVSYWIHVHIADPTALISHNDSVSILSQTKCSSIYLPDRHHPLLPTSLTNGAFGLCQGGKALTFSARIGSDGDICDWKVGGSVLKNVHKLSYDEVDLVADWAYINASNPSLGPWSTKQLELTKPLEQLTSTPSITAHMTADIIKIQELTHLHLAFRARNGGLIPDAAELGINVSRTATDSTIHINAFAAPHLSPSHRAVAESMIIAGRVAAKFCSTHGISAPYRGQAHILTPCQTEPHHSLSTFKSPSLQTNDKLVAITQSYENALKQRDEYGVVSQFHMIDLYGSMSAGVNDLRPISHFSMGIPGIDPASASTTTSSDAMLGYVKTTSPLRRYLDMVVHWQIKSALLRDSDSSVHRDIFSKEDLKLLVPRLAGIDRKIKKVSGVFESAWLIEWVRRREAYFIQHGVDILDSEVSRGVLGVGIALANQQRIKAPIRRRYEEIVTSPVYEVVVMRGGARVVEGAEEYASIRDAVVIELGCKKVEVFGRVEKLCAVNVGDTLKCRVLTADPYSNYLRMIIVE